MCLVHLYTLELPIPHGAFQRENRLPITWLNGSFLIRIQQSRVKTGPGSLAFLKLKQKYPKVCLVHLYTLEGAIHNTEYNRLSEDTKKELKEFKSSNSGLKQAQAVSVSASQICKKIKSEEDSIIKKPSSLSSSGAIIP